MPSQTRRARPLARRSRVSEHQIENISSMIADARSTDVEDFYFKQNGVITEKAGEMIKHLSSYSIRPECMHMAIVAILEAGGVNVMDTITLEEIQGTLETAQ